MYSKKSSYKFIYISSGWFFLRKIWLLVCYCMSAALCRKFKIYLLFIQFCTLYSIPSSFLLSLCRDCKSGLMNISFEEVHTFIKDIFSCCRKLETESHPICFKKKHCFCFLLTGQIFQTLTYRLQLVLACSLFRKKQILYKQLLYVSLGLWALLILHCIINIQYITKYFSND